MGIEAGITDFKSIEETKEAFKKWDELADLKILKSLVNDTILTREESYVLSESIDEIQWVAREELNKLIAEVNVDMDLPLEDMNGQQLKNILKKAWDLWDKWVSTIDLNDEKEKELEQKIENWTISPENKEKYKYANDWYKKHGWLSDSSQIRGIQEALSNIDGFNDVVIDWNFTKEFFNAVMKYQKESHIKDDWLVWRETLWNMMETTDTRDSMREYYDVAENNAKEWYDRHWWTDSKQIKQIKEALDKSLPHEGITINKNFDQVFFNAIKTFQEQNWLDNDWKAWAKTLQKLWLITSNSNSKAKAFYR